MRSRLFLLSTSLVAFLLSCSNPSTISVATGPNVLATAKDNSPQVGANSIKPSQAIASTTEIMARKQVPVLCYHHISETVSKSSMGYDVSIAQFKAQMKTLADSGYKTITPDQLYNYLAYGSPLPEKPMMLTYDDTDEEQFSIAKPEMDKYGFKGVYFIMTISIGRPRYMTKEQIKQLSDEGHVIASHTWDHHRVDKLKDQNTIDYRGKKTVVNEWDFQLTNPKKQLEELVGKPVDYFAYPFGIWSKEALPKIEERGYKMAFQLSTQRDSVQPLYTVRRIIVAPEWSATGLIKVMKSSFK